ncbi:MAG TPA: FHA domain-containing protein [Rhizomicrobium sp.]|nr:FHA domain-containing protein [Rhizomicrobium sp.]
MNLFSGIEKSIERQFQRWTERLFGASESNELMLTHRAILAEIETKVEILARGRRIFPYSRVTVTMVSPDANRRAMLETAFGERLESDVREALASAGCEVPADLAIEVGAVEEGPKPFEIAYAVAEKKPPEPAAAETTKAAPAPTSEPAAPPEPARLITAKGRTQQVEFELTGRRVNIGRLAELTDSEHRVIRRNHIVFDEGADEANATVSRKHAHIRFEEGEYRLCDDESEYGTRVFRDGRSIEVPAGNRRGEKLRPGDEIYLGRACLLFE